MDWNAIQAVAEIVAAFGVVASLVYLGRQVRHSAVSAQAATVLQSADLMQRSRAMIWSNDSNTQTYLIALSAADPGNFVTDIRQRMFWCDISRVHEAIFYQHETGHLPDSVWDSWQEEMRIVWSTPGGRVAMVAFDNKWLSPSFARYLELIQLSTPVGYMDQFRQRWSEGLLEQRARPNVETGSTAVSSPAVYAYHK